MELFRRCSVDPNVRNRRSCSAPAQTTQNGRKLDMVRPRDASQNFFVRSDHTFAGSRRCDPV